MPTRQTGFILLGTSVNLLVVIIISTAVLGYFTNAIAIQSRVREQEKVAFLVANYLITGKNDDPLFVLEEKKHALDAWLVRKEIEVYTNNRLIFTTVRLESHEKKYTY